MTEVQGASPENLSRTHASASDIYGALTSLVMHSEQTRWVRINALLVVDAIFVAAWAGIFVGTTSFAGKELLLVVLCLPGFVLGIAFAFLGWRSSQYMDDFHNQAYTLEQQFPQGLPRPFHASEKRRGSLRSGASRFTSSKWLVTAIPVGFSLLFAYLAVLPFVLQSCRP
jgi:hypothetical protein